MYPEKFPQMAKGFWSLELIHRARAASGVVLAGFFIYH
jgi:hypothetical protein